jgi:hypothetical protein
VRLAIALAALSVAATPASAAASDWRADGNAICTDYYDAVAVFLGAEGDSPTPDLLNGMARLNERKDARLTRVRPPESSAERFADMLRHDRRSSHALRLVARAMTHGDASDFERLLNRYDRETKAFTKLARGLKLTTCAGGGDAVTGPAVEL